MILGGFLYVGTLRNCRLVWGLGVLALLEELDTDEPLVSESDWLEDLDDFADEHPDIMSSLLSNGVLTMRPLAQVIAASVGLVSLCSMEAACSRFISWVLEMSAMAAMAAMTILAVSMATVLVRLQCQQW